MRIGITGNIGCGKSTFVRMLLNHLPHYAHFDFDQAVHALYGDTAFVRKLDALFGTHERRAVSDQAFGSPEKRRRLERASADALFPQLGSALAAQDIVVEFPLLCESAWHLEKFDLVVVVQCDAQTQRARIRARNAFAEEKIDAILAAQLSTEAKAAFAHVQVDTAVTLEALDSEARKLAATVSHGDLKQRCLADFGSVALWQALEKAYREPGRYYHTLAHLQAMFRHYDAVKASLNYPVAVCWAIWFHDFVYDARAEFYPQNESLSARALVQQLREHSPALLSHTEDGLSSLALAVEFILATKGHAVASPFLTSRPKARNDCEHFLDIDLAILSQSAERVAAFDDAVRKEFWRYDTATFAAGRIDALNHFLCRDRVYLSSAFTTHESAAREKLQQLIAKWAAQ